MEYFYMVVMTVKVQPHVSLFSASITYSNISFCPHPLPTANELLQPEQHHPLPSYRDYIHNSSVRTYQTAYFPSRCPQDTESSAGQVRQKTLQQVSAPEQATSLKGSVHDFYKLVLIHFRCDCTYMAEGLGLYNHAEFYLDSTMV